MKQVDVVIVGGGPVGLGLAIDLALRGVSACVVEKYPSLQAIPKGQNLTQRTGEHFRCWGVSEAIRAATPIPPEYGNEGVTTYGSLLSGYDYDWFKRASIREFYAADNERLPQYDTERVLRERVESLPGVELLLGWCFKDMQCTSEAVELTIQETDGDAEQIIQASYLAGCDGSRSVVREVVGLTETIDARDRRMALLVFHSPELHNILEERFPGKTIFNALHPEHEGYWQFLGRVDLDSNWFFHAPVPIDADTESYDFQALLHQAVGTEFSAEFSYIGFWDLRFTQADSYGSGRVFIAGDAAHSHPPYGGFGINTGFEDARNLSWKLAANIQGWGTQALLDSYSIERHPVFASTRDNFIAKRIEDDAGFTAQNNPETDIVAFESAWQQRASGGQSEVVLYVPNYAGSPIIWGEQGAQSGAIGEHIHQAIAGFHLSPQLLDNDIDVYELMSVDFTLIVLEQAKQVVDAFSEAAHNLGMPLQIICSNLNQQNQRWEAKIILVRPDHFIAFAANEVEIEPGEILARAIAMLN